MTIKGNNSSNRQQYVGSKNRQGPLNAGPTAKQRNSVMSHKAHITGGDEKQRKREARKQGRREMQMAIVDFRLAEIL
eukprot:CAMPEP_0119002692 /NCGR_PEP_ID=MMETSP1176-20130426/36_1 /TAXON_ID=265551 /ORGANISM="Synedropsis recta cf, Strain CCMP1620" /LENGTH=76 /DNA_ID=CAMNT_0006954199 /DNA_START=46 /DNA_END=276 /DNA_ORIENTATION=-